MARILCCGSLAMMDGVRRVAGCALFCVLAAFTVLAAAMILAAFAGIDRLAFAWASFDGSAVGLSSEAKKRDGGYAAVRASFCGSEVRSSLRAAPASGFETEGGNASPASLAACAAAAAVSREGDGPDVAAGALFGVLAVACYNQATCRGAG